MGAIGGVIYSYFGGGAAVSLGPLSLYDVGAVQFWEQARQGHVSTWQSMDHFCLGNDICSLALRKQTGSFSVQVMFKQSFS